MSKIDVRKIFPLPKSTLLLWIVLSVILSVIPGTLSYQSSVAHYTESVKLAQLNALNQAEAVFLRHINEIEVVVKLLKTESAVFSGPNINTSMQALFSRYLQVLPSAQQIRFIDSNGDEKVRVDRKNGRIVIIPPSALQNKRHRYFVDAGLKYDAQSVFYSYIDLNMEYGKVERPFNPVLRAGISTDSQHSLGSGVFVVNFGVGQTLATLRQQQSEENNIYVNQVNKGWLLHPDPSQEWSEVAGIAIRALDQTFPVLAEELAQTPNTLAQQVSETGVSSATNISLNNVMETGSTPLQIIINQPSEVYQQRISASLFPAVMISIAVFFVLLLLLSREAHNRWQMSALTDTLRTDKEKLKTALVRQETLHNELVESKKLASMGLMVAGVSHELNSPLGGIGMSVSTLRHQLGTVEVNEDNNPVFINADTYKMMGKALDIAERNLENANTIINSFKRLAIDRAKPEMSKISLGDCLNDLAIALKGALKKHRTTLEISLPQPIWLTTEPGILTQVLQNLIENAITHAFTSSDKGRIKISAIALDNYIVIEVADNGHGIAPDVLDKLFDPFITTNRSGGNIGLGLNLVHQWVVHVLQGKISVDSQQTPPSGTTFQIQLPFAIEAKSY